MLRLTAKFLDAPPAAAKAVFLPHAVSQYVSHVLWEAGYTQIALRINGLHYSNPRTQHVYIVRAFSNLADETDPASREITQRIEQGFIRALVEGKYTAWARRTPLYGMWLEMPPKAWLHLRIHELSKGTVKCPEDIILYEMRVGERISIPNLTPGGRSRSQKPLDWVAAELIRLRHQETLPTSKKAAAELLAPLYAARHPHDKKPVSIKRIKNWLVA